MEYNGALAILLMFGMCVFVPLGLLAALVYVITRKARARHEERMAMIAQGLAPAPDGTTAVRARIEMESDSSTGLSWAVGLIVCGIIWVLGAHFAAILIGAGAAFLTRGILGMRRDAASPTVPPPPLPPGEPR